MPVKQVYEIAHISMLKHAKLWSVLYFYGTLSVFVAVCGIKHNEIAIKPNCKHFFIPIQVQDSSRVVVAKFIGSLIDPFNHKGARIVYYNGIRTKPGRN